MINIIMSEFGDKRVNRGGGNFGDLHRLDPTLTSFSSWFRNDELKLTVYSDYQIDVKGFDIETEVKIVDKISSGHRSGYHSADYYKFYGMLNSPHETAIAMDSDMLVMSKAVRTLPYLAKKFGICLPMNPRLLVNIDGTKGDDGNYKVKEDKSNGWGLTYNLTPMACNPKDSRTKKLLTSVCEHLQKKQGRGATAVWRGMRDTGITPNTLSFHWCVCDSGLGMHADPPAGNVVGIKNAVMLHIGHEKVKNHYIKDWDSFWSETKSRHWTEELK
tara:strand:+ start:943 stop:1761 length:819 start_codon:yes stop_codon:yes gene_type:complete